MLRRSARNSTAKAGPSDQRGDSHPDKNSKAKAKQDLSEDPEDIDMLDAAEDDKDDDEDSRSSKFLLRPLVQSASSIRYLSMHADRIAHTQERSKRPAKAPPKKRAKVAHPTGSANVKISSATKGKQRRSLNLLLTMPLDVLFGVRLRSSYISCICSTNDRYFATYHRRILSTCPVLRRSFAKCS